MERRYDVDYIRVLAFALLILYHVGMFFCPWGFHIKNEVIYPELRYPMLFLNQWRLPLLFVISGVGVFFAFRKRTGLQFAGERVRRLLIPLIFGCIFIVPPQIYYEYLDKGIFHGNYFFDFWPRQVFTSGIYSYQPAGAFSYHHLWFIFYLFLFSIILIPVFVYLRKHPDAWLVRKTRQLAGKRAGLYFFIIPLFLWEFLLQRRFPVHNALVGDWFALVNFSTLFFFGFLLASTKNRFWENVSKYRKFYLFCGIAGFTTLTLLWNVLGNFPLKYEFYCAVKVFNLWSWILAIFGFAAVYLNKPGRFLSYANQAVYPFYIIHQTVIIIMGYYLKNIAMGFWPKFSIMVIGTFGITWLIYEFGVRRIKFMRPLFGLKPVDGK